MWHVNKFIEQISDLYTQNLYALNIVDCEWDVWTIGECSKSCGGGLQINTREELINEANGGDPCTGSSTVTESCNINECPGNKRTINLISSVSL